MLWWCLRLANRLAGDRDDDQLVRSARIKGATTKVEIAFGDHLCVTSIKPIAPDTKSESTTEEIGPKIVKMLDLALQ